MQADPSGAEIDAYLDGELDLSRQLAVEDHLARRPEAAARIMAMSRERTALRLLAFSGGEAPPQTRAAATILAARLKGSAHGAMRRPLVLATIGGAAGLLMLLAFVAGRSSTPSLPDYVADAMVSYRTGLLRAAMISQIESPKFDENEVRRSTHIRVPRLPVEWIITDAQIFPSDEGPALQLMVRTADGQELSIFAVRAGSAAPRSPTAIRHGEASVAYWREGEMSYALIGTGTPEALDLSAEVLATERMG